MIKVTHYMRRPEYGAHSIERLFSDIRSNIPGDIEVTVRVNRFLSQGFFKRVYEIILAAFYQGDVNHITGDVHFLSFLLMRRRTVLTIHDCVMLGRLHGLKRWVLWFFWYKLPVKLCAVITVISESTRRELLSQATCNPDKVVVIYDCVSDEFKPSPKVFNTQRPRLLHLGTRLNKNLERLAAALDGINCDLIIIGKLQADQIEVLNRHHVQFENYVNLSREALVEQYNACDMLVFASTYEGFGLPIVEANAVGRPVVTSNILSMPEVAGNAACLVDPFNVASIREGIIKVIENQNYRNSLVENGFENVKRFSAKIIASHYADLYRKLSNKENA